MIAHVICCNDAVKYVVLDDEDAAYRKLEALADEHYKLNKSNYKNYAEYRNIYYWHLCSVKYIKGLCYM